MYRQTDRGKWTDRYIDKRTERQESGQIDISTDKQTERQEVRQIDVLADRQTDRKVDR